MATTHFHLSRRMPLHPLDNNSKSSTTCTDDVLVSNPKQKHRMLHSTPTKNMETTTAHELNSSLAEELDAIRKKMERLRLDKEKTEKLLKDREALLHFQFKEIEERGLIQQQLEIQVDRLFRLKELKSYSMRISPLKSLRERQRGGWSINEAVRSPEIKEDESADGTPLQTPTTSNLFQIIREERG